MRTRIAPIWAMRTLGRSGRAVFIHGWGWSLDTFAICADVRRHVSSFQKPIVECVFANDGARWGRLAPGDVSSHGTHACITR